jgi:hypothetical protein
MRKTRIRNITYVVTSIVAVSIIAIVFFFWGVNSASLQNMRRTIKTGDYQGVIL